ncbi:hypothetical protein PAXINDRAFT_8355 [Paxillus involutus ATCC 200175]|nr:hypothetical protein PAXINDRAFT_8355 [Paxillus involutus ATCC 200175]
MAKQFQSPWSRNNRQSGPATSTEARWPQTWHLDAVLEDLPVLLQLSLLLFAVGLSASLWGTQKTVASVVIVMTICGTLFYISIVMFSLMSIDCPFQIPASRLLRMIGPSLTKSPPAFEPSFTSPYQPSWPTQPIEVLNAPSVRWILETFSDPDVIATAATLVPEVEWPIKLDASTMLAQLRDTFLSCFEGRQYGQPKLVHLGRERVIACGKAFVHMYIERRSIQTRPLLPHGTYDPDSLSSPTVDMQWLLWVQHDDPELLFTCDLILEVVLDVGMVTPLSLRASMIPDLFLEWMSHSLPHCLTQPHNVLANCLMAAGLLLGQTVDRHESALADGFHVMSMRNNVGDQSKICRYVPAIAFALGADRPLPLRRAALRAAHAGRWAFSSFDEDTMPATLRSKLSTALRLAVTTELGNKEADIELVGRHDLRYLQIILALSSSSPWMNQLCEDGHLACCHYIARDLETFKLFPLTDQLVAYLLSTTWLLQNHSDKSATATVELSDDIYRCLFNMAWGFAARSHKLPFSSDFHTQDFIHGLTELTIQRVAQDSGLKTEELKSLIKQTFNHLTDGPSQSSRRKRLASLI